MSIRYVPLALVTIVIVTAGSRASAQHPAMPPGMTHDEHLAQMKKDGEMKQRGAEAMGFDQDTTRTISGSRRLAASSSSARTPPPTPQDAIRSALT
jgi:hypothetical protein